MVWAITSEEDDREDEINRSALAAVRSAIEGEGFHAVWFVVAFLLCLFEMKGCLLRIYVVRFVMVQRFPPPYKSNLLQPTTLWSICACFLKKTTCG